MKAEQRLDVDVDGGPPPVERSTVVGWGPRPRAGRPPSHPAARARARAPGVLPVVAVVAVVEMFEVVRDYARSAVPNVAMRRE